VPRLIIEEDQQKRYHKLSPGVTRVGRAETNAVRIDDIKSSRCHCEIKDAGGHWVLVDLGSQNGTRVNNVKVDEHTLAPGDVIQIGSTLITFEDLPVSARLPRLEAPTAPLDDSPPSDGGTTTGRTVRRRHGGLARRARRRRALAPPPLPDTPHPTEGVTRLRTALTANLKDWIGTFGERGAIEAHAIYESVLEKRAPALLRRYTARIETLERIQRLTQDLNSELDLDALLERIVDAAIEITGAERGLLLLADEAQMTVEVARHYDRSSLDRTELQLSRGVCERVLRDGEAVIAMDAQDDERLGAYMSVAALSLKSVMCLPLLRRDVVIGAIYLDNRTTAVMFDEENLDVLETFADQAAIAIANARLHRENASHVRELERTNAEIEALAGQLQATVKQQEDDLVEARTLLQLQASELGTRYRYDQIIGRSKAMRTVLLLLDKITDSNAPVLIAGESGTGKELVARAIHFNGPRQHQPFVGENCAAFSDSLLESELFGHVKGAFTGAATDKKGLFELASGGTLFLDEIGDMSADMQKKLLRVLQDGHVRPVGGKDSIAIDVRVISASNRDLAALVASGEFREDLYYRVNAITVALPPLRDRKEDLPELARHFVAKLAKRDGKPVPTLEPSALERLLAHDWPGNVRELENEIHRAITLAGDRIGSEHLSERVAQRTGDTGPIAVPEATATTTLPALAPGQSLKDLVQAHTHAVERAAIEAVLAQEGHNKSAAARRLGISRPTLDAKLETLGIALPDR